MSGENPNRSDPKRAEPNPIQPVSKDPQPIPIFTPIRPHEQMVQLTPDVLIEAQGKGMHRLISGHEMPIFEA